MSDSTVSMPAIFRVMPEEGPQRPLICGPQPVNWRRNLKEWRTIILCKLGRYLHEQGDQNSDFRRVSPRGSPSVYGPGRASSVTARTCRASCANTSDTSRSILQCCSGLLRRSGSRHVITSSRQSLPPFAGSQPVASGPHCGETQKLSFETSGWSVRDRPISLPAILAVLIVGWEGRVMAETVATSVCCFPHAARG
jgi:hypothetical protein